MTEIRDPAIKLFGQTIPLPATDEILSSVMEDGREDQSSSSASEKKSTVGEENEVMEEDEKDKENAKMVEIMDIEMAGPISEDNQTETTTSSPIKESSKALSANKETSAVERTKVDKENSETSISKEKTVKKPDKILPCPRCNSLDTKFCYYNNYNVNQPRHFCKNCQRYWTAGGTMRNVPVGAGRRKNKNSASHYRHLNVSEALQAARTNVPDAIHRVPLKPNGGVVSFNFDATLCESMTSVLNLADKMMQNCHKNGFRRTEEQRILVSHGGENGEEHSSGSSVTASNSKRNCTKLQEPISQSRPGFPPQMSCFPGALWTCPAQWGSTVAPPPFCPSSFPLPYYPAAPYWGCAMPGPWNFPWMPLPSSSNTGSSGSGSNSPILQKHSREGETLVQKDEEKEDTSKQSSSERCLWIPKTLRIDDPSEAARSSIWATLGIKDDKSSSISSGGLFKAFQSKATDRNHTMETSQVLQANPAALSRSLDFHENS